MYSQMGVLHINALKRICQQLECLELLKPIEYALHRFGFCDEHVAYGAEHISEWYDLDLPSVRKLLTAYLKEFCSLYEETTAYKIYVSVPAPTVLSVALNETGRVRVYTPELCAMIVLRGIFGLSLASFGNCCEVQSRCEMLENRSEFIKRKFIPEPDLLWSFGLLCDECPKKDELIQSTQNIKTISTICPRDCYDESVFQYSEATLRKDIQTVCALAGVPVPNGKQAWQKAKLLGILVNTISCKVSGADHPPLKAATLSLLQSTQLMSFRDFDELLTAIQHLLKDVRRVQKDGTRKKLYCYYIPPCFPEFGTIFEKNGIHYRQEVYSSEWPTITRILGDDEKRFDFVIKTAAKTYLIEVNFYSGGGSKLNEVARSYSDIAPKINSVSGFEFVWITDGIGWKSAKNKLQEAYSIIPSIYNLTNIKDFINGIK